MLPQSSMAPKHLHPSWFGRHNYAVTGCLNPLDPACAPDLIGINIHHNQIGMDTDDIVSGQSTFYSAPHCLRYD